MTNLTEAEVLQVAKDTLLANDMGYDVAEGLKATYSRDTKLRDGRLQPVWVISYVTPPSIFDQYDHFMYISDQSGKVLYIMTQSGYVDGVIS